MRYLHQHIGRFVTLLAAVLLVVVAAMGQQKGRASYYSKKANGARTSSGVKLHNDSLFCAHKSYDFGTLLLVKNPANGKEVVVKVVDRGPHGRGRIIDITYEAARQLGIIAQGVAMVEVSVYDDTAIPYKPKDYHLPELNLEVQEQPDYHDRQSPEWQRARQDSAAHQKVKEHTQDNKEKNNEGIHGRRTGANTR